MVRLRRLQRDSPARAGWTAGRDRACPRRTPADQEQAVAARAVRRSTTVSAGLPSQAVSTAVATAPAARPRANGASFRVPHQVVLVDQAVLYCGFSGPWAEPGHTRFANSSASLSPPLPIFRQLRPAACRFGLAEGTSWRNRGGLAGLRGIKPVQVDRNRNMLHGVVAATENHAWLTMRR